MNAQLKDAQIKSSKEEYFGDNGVFIPLYSSEGYTNQVVKGGVCIRHGAKKKKKTKCSSEGCRNRS